MVRAAIEAAVEAAAVELTVLIRPLRNKNSARVDQTRNYFLNMPTTSDDRFDFVSTRGTCSLSLGDLMVQGVCPEDGGLFVPSRFPFWSRSEIQSWRGLSFEEISIRILHPFFAQVLSEEELKEIVYTSYSTFLDERIAPLRKVKDLFLLELFHGPTLSFKDIALQFLGNYLDLLLKKKPAMKKILVLGATSGDTGSAAIAGLAGKAGMQVVILYPDGKISTKQELQMVTSQQKNVYAVACPGIFDDCQRLVKEAFKQDSPFQQEYQLLAVNSINIVRILVQCTYYFYAYLQLLERGAIEEEDLVDFYVPTGNFGDVLAGHYARRMGLPTGRLHVATNANDIVHRCIQNGLYELDRVKATITPAMDIQVASNFERYIYEITGTERIKELMGSLTLRGRFKLSPKEHQQLKEQFDSTAVSEQQCIEAIKHIYSIDGSVIDPHSATAVSAALLIKEGNVKVCLATAHPAKFPETVISALGQNIQALNHPALLSLEALPKHKHHLNELTMESLFAFTKQLV